MKVIKGKVAGRTRAEGGGTTGTERRVQGEQEGKGVKGLGSSANDSVSPSSAASGHSAAVLVSTRGGMV